MLSDLEAEIGRPYLAGGYAPPSLETEKN